MKLILAGDGATYSKNDFQPFINNCNLGKCERRYTIPIPELSALQFYVYFGANRPTTIEIDLVSTCVPQIPCFSYTITNTTDAFARWGGITCNGVMIDAGLAGGASVTGCYREGSINVGEGFTVVKGADCNRVELQAQDYVVGQDANGMWYGVFKNFIVVGEYNPSCFIVSFLIDDKRYFSEEYCIEATCIPLTELRACYPDNMSLLGFDMQNIYYGYHTGEPSIALGDVAIRYYHRLFVRDGQVVRTSNKTTFKVNRTRNFRSQVEKLFELRCEFVPEWYSDYIMAVVARGVVEVALKVGDARKKYVLNDTLFELVDEDSKLWKPFAKFIQVFRHFFGCDEGACVRQCMLAPDEVDYEGAGADYIFTFTGGAFAGGDVIEWELYSKTNGSLISDPLIIITNGEINAAPLEFTILDVDHHLNFDDNCYLVKWRKRCASIDDGEFNEDFNDDFNTGSTQTQYTPWQTKEFGNCVNIIDPSSPYYYYNAEIHSCVIPGLTSNVIVKCLVNTLVLGKWYHGKPVTGADAWLILSATNNPGYPVYEVQDPPFDTKDDACNNRSCVSYVIKNPGAFFSFAVIKWTNCDGSPGAMALRGTQEVEICTDGTGYIVAATGAGGSAVTVSTGVC